MLVYVRMQLGISTEFDRYVLEHPEFAEKIPPNAQVVYPQISQINADIFKFRIS